MYLLPFSATYNVGVESNINPHGDVNPETSYASGVPSDANFNTVPSPEFDTYTSPIVSTTSPTGALRPVANVLPEKPDIRYCVIVFAIVSATYKLEYVESNVMPDGD